MKRHQQSCGEPIGLLFDPRAAAANHDVLVAIDAAVETSVLFDQLAVQDVVSELVPDGVRATLRGERASWNAKRCDCGETKDAGWILQVVDDSGVSTV